MNEISFFEETGPSITTQAFAEEAFKHTFFQDHDFTVSHGGFEGEIHKASKNKFGIEFVITLWHKGSFDYAGYQTAMKKIHMNLSKEYGPMVAGDQPPAQKILDKINQNF